MNIAFCVWPVITLSLIYGVINFFTSKNSIPKISRKTLGIGSIIFTLIATELGGSVMLGTCQEAYTSGLFGLLYIIGISIGLILLSIGFAAKMKAMNVQSTLDLFILKYHSPSIRFCASLLSTMTVCGLLIGQILAAKALFQALGISNEITFIIFWALALLYTILGGFTTAGITYNAQLIYIICIFSGIFTYCVFKEPPSFFQTTFADKTFLFNSCQLNFSTIFASLVMPALYYITDQDFAQPFFNIKSNRMKLFTALGASFFMILFSLVPIYFGIKAKALNLAIPEESSPLIPILGLLTNEWTVILAVCGIIAALIATIDSYLWSISYSISYDFNLASNNQKFIKMITFFIGLLVLAASYAINTSVVQMIISSYELYDSCLIVPLLMSYFKTDLKKGSAIGSILFGLFGFIFFRIFIFPFSGQIASLLLSFIGFLIGGYLEKLIYKINLYKSSYPSHL
jgi:SSS family solute:Na+ symporter